MKTIHFLMFASMPNKLLSLTCICWLSSYGLSPFFSLYIVFLNSLEATKMCGFCKIDIFLGFSDKDEVLVKQDVKSVYKALKLE